MPGVDDEDVVKLVGQVVGRAQEVDGLADRPVRRHRYQVALHEPAGAVLGEGQPLLHRDAVRLGHRGEDRLLLRLVEVLDEVDGVVGVELGDRRGELVGAELLDDLVAHRLVELGEDVGVELGAQRVDHQAAFIGGHDFQEVGHVGGVERHHQRLDAIEVVRLERLLDRPDQLGRKPVKVRRCRPQRRDRLFGNTDIWGRRIVECGNDDEHFADKHSHRKDTFDE